VVQAVAVPGGDRGVVWVDVLATDVGTVSVMAIGGHRRAEVHAKITAEVQACLYWEGSYVMQRDRERILTQLRHTYTQERYKELTG